jgi:signal transduction histidine kinase
MNPTRPRILCVDDEPLVLKSLADILRRRYDVTTAGSGEAGLHALADNGSFDVVVSDFLMPGMSGAEFLALARVASPDSVRVLLTGQASLDHAITVVNEASIFRFLTKPCSPTVLLQSIDEAVEQSRLINADHALVERRLESMADHLRRAERLASVGTLAGAVGHELRNALAALRGAIAFICEDVASGRLPAEEDLETLRQAEAQLTGHATNLLNLGRSSRGAGEPAADVRQAINDVVAMLRSAGSLHRAQIRVDMPPAPVAVPASRLALQQVVMNIVKNSLDALAGRQLDTAVIEIGLRPSADQRSAVCTVSDNGEGIPASRLPLVFEPYFTTKPPDQGTGLGLFVVRQIVQSAGGSIAVESRPGEGTCFTVTLPLVA